MRNVCRVPWTTHCHLLPHIFGVMDSELWFSKRCIKLIKMALNSDNIIVPTIINVGLNGTQMIRIRINRYFILVLKTINISFKLSVTNYNKKKHITIKFIK